MFKNKKIMLIVFAFLCFMRIDLLTMDSNDNNNINIGKIFNKKLNQIMNKDKDPDKCIFKNLLYRALSQKKQLNKSIFSKDKKNKIIKKFIDSDQKVFTEGLYQKYNEFNKRKDLQKSQFYKNRLVD